MDGPISPFEKWRLETIPQVGFTPEIRELLAMAFEGGRKYVEENQEIGEAEIRQMLKEIEWCHQELEKQEWQSLSDDEIDALEMNPNNSKFKTYKSFARAIEQALKEKNNV